jgi:hypothetical protein
LTEDWFDTTEEAVTARQILLAQLLNTFGFLTFPGWALTFNPITTKDGPL